MTGKFTATPLVKLGTSDGRIHVHKTPNWKIPQRQLINHFPRYNPQNISSLRRLSLYMHMCVHTRTELHGPSKKSETLHSTLSLEFHSGRQRLKISVNFYSEHTPVCHVYVPTVLFTYLLPAVLGLRCRVGSSRFGRLGRGCGWDVGLLPAVAARVAGSRLQGERAR